MKTLSDLREAYAEAGLLELFNELKPYARNSIVIEVEREFEPEEVGMSRFGGDPDLPPDVEWFSNPSSGVSLSFVAQINCAECHDVDLDNQLPDHGILYFFYDLDAYPWGFSPEDKAGSLVYFYDGPVELLEKRSCPNDIACFSSSALVFSNQVDLPEYSSWLVEHTMSDAEYERYLDLHDELGLDVDHKLLGHSNNIQKGMELQCELVNNGIDCGSIEAYHDPRLAELATRRFDWRLLFQISSYDEDDMQWGDDGSLYFWIRAEDLAAKSFDRAWSILQSF